MTVSMLLRPITILNPPTGWTLDDVGVGFPETLKQLFPDDPEVEELAWLEWEMQQVFIAPDSRKMDGAAFAEATADFGDDDWAEMRLAFAPEIRLRPIATAAALIWEALSRSEAPGGDVMLPSQTRLMIWREGLRPCFRQLEPPEAEALDMMLGGATFGSMCEFMQDSGGATAEMAGAMLGRWIGDELIAGLAV